MHAFRSHTCAELTEANVGQPVRLSGWVNRKRDHGQLVFVDLRDHYGLTQCVVDSSDPTFAAVEATRLESVVTITGTVLKRSDDTINTSLPTGHIEVRIEQFEVQSAADTLPLQVNSDVDSGEEAVRIGVWNSVKPCATMRARIDWMILARSMMLSCGRDRRRSR